MDEPIKHRRVLSVTRRVLCLRSGMGPMKLPIGTLMRMLARRVVPSLAMRAAIKEKDPGHEVDEQAGDAVDSYRAVEPVTEEQLAEEEDDVDSLPTYLTEVCTTSLFVTALYGCCGCERDVVAVSPRSAECADQPLWTDAREVFGPRKGGRAEVVVVSREHFTELTVDQLMALIHLGDASFGQVDTEHYFTTPLAIILFRYFAPGAVSVLDTVFESKALP